MLLLDTHYLIWWATNAPQLSQSSKRLIETAPVVYFSAASIFEIESKRHRLKTMPSKMADFFERLGFEGLPISVSDAAKSSDFSNSAIPDPFDRLLLAQASNRGLDFLTADEKILSQRFDFVLEASD
jgi:PIN domain nuclease of toxin-antitoxin system